MNLTMPTMLGWVLGGNTSALARSARVPFCRVGDKPKAFCESVRGARIARRAQAPPLHELTSHGPLTARERGGLNLEGIGRKPLSVRFRQAKDVWMLAYTSCKHARFP